MQGKSMAGAPKPMAAAAGMITIQAVEVVVTLFPQDKVEIMMNLLFLVVTEHFPE